MCPSDLAVAFSALDATATIYGPAGAATLAVAELYTPRRIELDVGEILTEVRVPLPQAEARRVFKKVSAHPLRSNAYKVEIARALLRRTLGEVAS